MPSTFFLFTFSLILLIANIYCFFKKKYLYLFIPCMLFLPKYYGIAFNNTLPVLTVSRMMFIIFYIYAYLNRKKDIKSIKFQNILNSKELIFLLAYFIFRIIANLHYISTYSSALKTIFEIIFEQLLLIISLYLLAPSKQEITTLIKIVVFSALPLFIVGILESLFFIRPFDSLYTVSRDMPNEHYIRLGLLRSTTTLGFPGLFGNMCILIFPLIIYLYKETHKKIYFIVCYFNIIALFHSGCRSDLIFLVVILVSIIFFSIIFRENKKRMLINTVIIILSLVFTIVCLSLFNENYKYYYLGTFKSLLNTVGFEYDLNKDAPSSVVEGFGSNTNAVKSRTFQLSGITYTLSKEPVYGLGNGALENHNVFYYSYGAWREATACDMGLVEIIVYEGMLGLIAHIFILLSFILYCIKYILSNKLDTKSSILLFVLPFAYLLSTLSTVNMYNYLFSYLSIFYAAVLENKNISKK